LFPVVSLRREPGFLVFQITLGDFPECILARRLVAEHLRLLDAKQLGRADLLRLRDVLRVGLAKAAPPLRVRPGDPPARPVLALVYAVSLLRRLLRHRLFSPRSFCRDCPQPSTVSSSGVYRSRSLGLHFSARHSLSSVRMLMLSISFLNHLAACAGGT